MLPKDFWNTYAGGFAPLDFMRLFNSHDPVACAWAYVKERPSLYGIVRRGSWRETFAAERQFTRTEVHTGLSAYLEETQHEWRDTIERELAEAEAARREAAERAAEETAREETPQEAADAGSQEPKPEDPALHSDQHVDTQVPTDDLGQESAETAPPSEEVPGQSDTSLSPAPDEEAHAPEAPKQNGGQ